MILLWVLCIWVPFVCGSLPTQTDGTVEIKHVNYLGIEMSFAQYSLHFDQELYIHKSNFCPAYNCQSDTVDHYDQPDCVCDYTNLRGQCGRGYWLNDTTSSCDSECDQSLCSNKYSWSDISVNSTLTTQSFDLTLDEGQTRHFRFYVNQSCFGWHTFVTTKYGLSTFYISNQGIANNENSYWLKSNKEYKEEFYICPASAHYIHGTYFLAVSAYTPTQFTLTVEKVFVPQPNLTETEPTCNNTVDLVRPEIAGAQCVEQGQIFTRECSDSWSDFHYTNITFENGTCKPVYISMLGYGYGIDVDLYAGYVVDGSWYPSPEWISYYYSEDWTSFILCPRGDETSALIWIAAACWQHGSDYSNYSLYVTTDHWEHWEHTKLVDIPEYEFNFDMLGSAGLNAPQDVGDAGDYLTCENWKYSCSKTSYSFPSNDSSPFFPVPPVLLNLPDFGSIYRSIYGNYSIPWVPNPNVFSVILIISYKTDKSDVQLLPESDVDKVLVKFLGKVGSLEGQAMFGNHSVAIRQSSCDFTKFQEITEMMNNVIDSFDITLSTTELNSLRFYLDTMTFLDGYSACQDFVDNLTSTIPKHLNVSSYLCQEQDPDSVAWKQDPCCSPLQAWSEVCFARNMSLLVSSFAVQKEMVSQVCKNSECSESYLEDYTNAKASFETGQCSIRSQELSLAIAKVQQQYRDCKEEVYTIPSCYDDTDCVYASQNFSCDLFTYQCKIPFRVQEQTFVECLTAKLTEAQQVFIQAKYNITVDSDDPSFVTEWLNGVTVHDCVSNFGTTVNTDFRTKFIVSPAYVECASNLQCPSFQCEDTTCVYPELTCYPWCGAATSSFVESSQNLCESELVCNWNQSLCLSQSNCTNSCIITPPTSHFCGLCENYDNCLEFSAISTDTDCSSTTACILPNGTYVLNISDALCNSYQECTVDCGYTCESLNPSFGFGICYSYEANSADCNTKGGVWTLNNGTQSSNNSSPYVCVYPGETEISCGIISGTSFDTCSQLSTYDCAQCWNGYCNQFNQNLLTCKPVDMPCVDEPSCTNSGECTDAEYLVQLDFTTAYYGACVVPRPPPGVLLATVPYCPVSLTSVPNGCINLTYTTPETCPGEWWTPATSNDTCLQKVGCLDHYNGQPRFSPKDEGNCTSEYYQALWKTYFDWTPGRWVSGVQRNLTWTLRQTFSRYNWTETASFMQLTEDFYGSASQDYALQSKSAALCQYQRKLTPMTSVVCDCTESGSSDCFTSDPSSVIGQIQVCANTDSIEYFPESFLSFTESSVAIHCVNVLVSKISSEIYKTKSENKLLANFIPLVESNTDFAVTNDKGAVVGTLVSEGLAVTVLGDGIIESAEVCLEVTKSSASTFDTADFATTDSDFQKLIPREWPVYLRKLDLGTVYDGQYICAVVTNVTGESYYFAIERKANYEDEEILSDTSLTFSYVLAVSFLAISLLSFAQIMFYLWSFFVHKLALMLEHVLVAFIWLFVTVRAVYFFLLTAGFESDVADYALVALPTFFYFTAFTIIVVLWAVVASKRFTNDVDAFKRIINRSVLVINFLLYAIFVILVLAFQYGTTKSESPCQGRQDGEDNSDQVRRVISVIYGVLIAVISFIIGILFLVFGLRIKHFITGSESTERIFIVTAVCSVSFVLHSVFIIVVSFLPKPNLYFSFVGLILTEWFPSLFIVVWLFRQRSKALSGTTRQNTNSAARRSKNTDGNTSDTLYGRRTREEATIELSEVDT